MKVAVDLTTKIIIDLLPDEATDSSPYLINNGYVLLDIENPILNHIENEDGTLSVNFRDLTDEDFREYTSINYKAIRQEAVDNIEVTYNGVIYQGDEDSQSRMSRAINGLPDNTTTIKWKAKDNSAHELNKEDLKQILFLAGQEQTRIWFT